MLTIIFSLLIGIGVYYGSTLAWGWIWGTFCALFVMILFHVLIGWILRRKLGELNQKIQQVMIDGQEKLKKKAAMMQRRPGMTPKLMQEMLFKDQAVLLHQALELTEGFAPYYKWNYLLKKQTSTMKMTLYYQLKEFDKVDAMLKDCVFLDPMSIAMRFARMYRKGAKVEEMDRFYKSRARRLKGDDSAIVYATYAWILVKLGNIDRAIAILNDARKKTDAPVIVENLERLLNGKVKHFSNAMLGDAWYSLFLEEPKIRPQRQERMMY